MKNKRNWLFIVFIVVIAILCLVIGWLLGSKFSTVENEGLGDSNNNIEENNSIENIQLKNYDVNIIKNIEVRVPVKDSTDPEMRNVTITSKEQIKSILTNVDDAKEVGKVPEGIGFMFNVVITINYDGDPSTNIIILDNGNIAINKAVGVGETSYAEYEISNKNLAVEITDKYQN